ncbi:MAG TPA: flagellar protein FliS [Gemmatimonadaceae bacterium]|nr:flagellar protein FliS [Gemmatimonadaceae bacterium]
MGDTPTAAAEPTIPEQYELLLAKLARAERELEDGQGGRSGHLEEASGIVFDLLYSLDFKKGGELVPRLAALYGYIANELLQVGRTGDRAQLAHLRDMVTSLRQSWYGTQSAA